MADLGFKLQHCIIECLGKVRGQGGNAIVPPLPGAVIQALLHLLQATQFECRQLGNAVFGEQLTLLIAGELGPTWVTVEFAVAGLVLPLITVTVRHDGITQRVYGFVE